MEHLIDPDREAVALFMDLLPRLDAQVDRFDRIQAARAQPRSVMAADDQATNPMQLGQFVSYCLLQAVDMARTTAEVTRVPEGGLALPIMALYPLARAQIESASVALWVLSGEGRRGRIIRRLQAGHDELAHEKGLTRSAVVGLPDSEAFKVLRGEAQNMKRHKDYLRAIAKANGIDPTEYENRHPGWENIVCAAGREVPLERDALVTTWRFASGLTHPSMRRGVVALEFEQRDVNGNILSGVMSTKTRWALGVVSMAWRVTDAALTSWGAAKIQVNGERPVPTPLIRD